MSSKWGHGSFYTPAKKQMIKEALQHKIEKQMVIQHGDIYVPDFTDRVRAGMDLLDKICPGWQNEIDTDALDLESDENCVLGQSWSFYAKSHDLLEKADSGDYKDFADAVLGPLMDFSDPQLTDKGRRNIAAASLGFSMSEDDFEILNAQGEFGIKSFDILPQFWHALTMTWLTEISKARLDGRWEPYTVDALEKSIQANQEEPATA